MLWIPKFIYQNMIINAEKWAPFETGGVFMGYHAHNKDIVITNMIEAGPEARHRKYRFHPDQKYQLEQIEKIYYQSKNSVTYLGDWHTHPNNLPGLSFLDKRTLTKIAITPESQNAKPIMAILGGLPQIWTLNVVQFISGKLFLWPFVKCETIQMPHIVY